MSEEAQQADARNTIAGKPCRVIIDVESAKRMRDHAYESRRLSLRAAQHSLEFGRMMDVVIKAAS